MGYYADLYKATGDFFRMQRDIGQENIANRLAIQKELRALRQEEDQDRLQKVQEQLQQTRLDWAKGQQERYESKLAREEAAAASKAEAEAAEAERVAAPPVPTEIGGREYLRTPTTTGYAYPEIKPEPEVFEPGIVREGVTAAGQPWQQYRDATGKVSIHYGATPKPPAPEEPAVMPENIREFQLPSGQIAQQVLNEAGEVVSTRIVAPPKPEGGVMPQLPEGYEAYPRGITGGGDLTYGVRDIAEEREAEGENIRKEYETWKKQVFKSTTPINLPFDEFMKDFNRRFRERLDNIGAHDLRVELQKDLGASHSAFVRGTLPGYPLAKEDILRKDILVAQNYPDEAKGQFYSENAAEYTPEELDIIWTESRKEYGD